MVTVVYTDAEIQFRFPYSQLLNQALKRTFRELGYRWDSATKGWVVQTGPVAWRVAQDWIEGLRKLGVPLQEVDQRTKRPPGRRPPWAGGGTNVPETTLSGPIGPCGFHRAGAAVAI